MASFRRRVSMTVGSAKLIWRAVKRLEHEVAPNDPVSGAYRPVPVHVTTVADHHAMS
jgi:hypothetical protein